MKIYKQLITGCGLVAASVLMLVSAPAPAQAGDWGVSLNVPFVRVRSHGGYYYRDNDYNNRYSYRSHHYAPDKRYYYYPSQSRRDYQDARYDNWVGVNGSRYGEYYRR